MSDSWTNGRLAAHRSGPAARTAWAKFLALVPARSWNQASSFQIQAVPPLDVIRVNGIGLVLIAERAGLISVVHKQTGSSDPAPSLVRLFPHPLTPCICT
jgi:hypothetical protein